MPTILQHFYSLPPIIPQQADEIPDGFPFKIQHNLGWRNILLTREFGDEIIKVEVDMPNPDDTEEEDEEEEEEDDEEEEEEEEDEEQEEEEEEEDEEEEEKDDDDEDDDDDNGLRLVVSISKGDGACLEFHITAFPDEITIDSLTVKQPDDKLEYEGPDFNDVDKILQKAFYKYLKIRGINTSTTNFLRKYVTNTDSIKNMHWLKNIKKFFEK